MVQLFYQILPHAIFLASLVVTWKFIRLAFLSSTPQSPEALGKAIATVSFILGVSLYQASYIDDLLAVFTGLSLNIYLYVGFGSSILCLIASGFLAVRTSEDTQSMNIKLLMAIGALPFFLVTVLAFMNQPAWPNLGNVVLYIPAILFGKHIYFKGLTRQSSGAQAKSACAGPH